MAGISIQGITKRFKDAQVLNDVSLDIAAGEFLSLVGPSGCGKTTLLRILAGLETQDAGDVHIGGVMVDDLPPKARDIAMVFQSYALYPYMTVAENIALPLTMRRLSTLERLPLVGRLVSGTRARRAAIAADVRQVAESLAISHLMDRRPAQLSGGQRQRVALARAMVRRPRAFLMDEPLSNLDAKMRVQARTEIADLHRSLGSTFVYVTHDQAEAMTMSSRVAVMMGGELLQVAPPQVIYDDPADLRVATFIGTPEINVFAATARGDGAVQVAGRAWPLGLAAPAGTPVTVAVRPEAFALMAEPRADAGTVAGTIRHLEYLGAETMVHLTVPHAPKPVIARVEPMTGASLAIGTPATFRVQAGRVLLFGPDGKRLKSMPAPAPAARPAAIEMSHV